MNARRGPELGRWLLAAAILAFAAPGFRALVRLPSALEGERVMCEGLPDYAAPVAKLPPATRVRFWVDLGDPRASEKYFCAQLAAAPVLLVAPPLDREERRHAERLDWSLLDEPAGPRLAIGDFAWHRPEPWRRSATP